jgi:nicotinate phosphoribosyltransferase
VTVSALSTDLYELTMMAGHLEVGFTGPASFELFVRQLPESRSYLVAAGLSDVLDYLEQLRFQADEIEYLRQVPALRGAPPRFFDDYLPNFRFSGEVWAMREGTPVFAQEPLVRITAPLPEAQLVETALLAIISFQTSVASKASRVVEAADGRNVIEFGARRAHGPDAARAAARASFIGGCDATSNVEAGYRYGIPVAGTMAHSWVLAFGDELEAFRRFTELYGERAILLLDTFDTIAATRTMLAGGFRPPAVRLDSGDIDQLSREVRRQLDGAGLHETRIFVSGDMDEHRIQRLVAARAPVDGFGVGASLTTSADAPALGGVYKLVEVRRHGADAPVMKLSADKQTYPGRKQVYRVSRDGLALRDVIALSDEPALREASPLLECVMRDGRRLRADPSLDSIREGTRALVASLPAAVRRIEAGERLPVSWSEGLTQLTHETMSSAANGSSSGPAG